MLMSTSLVTESEDSTFSKCGVLSFFTFFSFRVLNLNNAGDSAVEKERDSWIEVYWMQLYLF